MPDIDNRGIRLSYDVRGSGRPLILLHGWSCDRGWWEHTGFVEALAEDHHIVNVDLRGHGRSSRPHDPSAYVVTEVVSDVLAVADAEGIDRFSIWGLSYGGFIGWLTGAARPERVAALVTSGAWLPFPSGPSPGVFGGESLEEMQEWWDTDLELAAIRRDGAAGMTAYRKASGGESYDVGTENWKEVSFLATDPQALLAIQDPTLWGQGLRSVEDYPVPVLLISGSLEDPDNGAARVAEAVPRGESMWLHGLGHAGACSASALTVPTARAFLDRWDSQTA